MKAVLKPISAAVETGTKNHYLAGAFPPRLV
jgi:hypothetical protein